MINLANERQRVRCEDSPSPPVARLAVLSMTRRPEEILSKARQEAWAAPTAA